MMHPVRMALTLVAAIIIGSSAGLSQDMPRQVPYEPDHLIPERDPTEARDHSYQTALRENLRLDATFFARMVVLPSFDGESCLRLHGPEGESDITKASRFFLTSYQADQSLWQTLPERDHRKLGPVVVAVSTAPIPTAFARRIKAIWDEMLSRTRPPDQPSTVLDGVSFEFSTPEISARARNPMRRLSPALFTELARSLMDLCEAKPENRAGRIEIAEQHATVLENYLKAHPIQ